MSLPRSRGWASVDDREPPISRARRPMSPQLQNLLPLVLLVGAVSADRFGIRWHGVDLRLELIAAVVLAAAAIVTWQVARVRLGLIEWCLAGWLAVGAFSSVVFSPAPRDSLRLTLLLVGMVAIYGVTIVLLRSRADLVRAALVWIAVGTVVAAIGLVDGILYALVGSHVGIAFDGTAMGTVVVFAPRVTSTLWEANIFGSYMLIVWALAFALSLTPGARTPGRKWGLRIAMAAATIGIVISTTRVVWVVAPLLMLSMLAVALQRRLLPWRRLLADFVNPNLVGFAIGLALATAMSVVACPAAVSAPYVSAPSNPTAGAPAAASNPLLGRGCFTNGSVFMQHGQGLFQAGSTSSFTGRLKIAQQALKGWLHRPVLGYGSGSYSYVFGAAAIGWLGNLPLHILFDTGIVGFVLLLIALVAAGRAAFRALSAVVTAWEPAHFVLFGLVAAGLALLVTYEFTDGTWLGFTWVFLGMLVAGGRLTRGIAPRLRPA
jgi:O-Antigen ligase